MKLDYLKEQEETLRREIAKLEPTQKKQYYKLELERIKDPDTYAVLNYFFIAGLHHFYLGRITLGSINFISMLIGVSFIGSWGWMLLIGIFIVELRQLFLSQGIVYAYNNRVMQDILKDVSP